MSAQKRLQQRRTKGWRKPEGAVAVGRPGRFGNPFTIDGAILAGYASTTAEARKVVVNAFRDWLHGDTWAAGSSPEWEETRLRFLTGLPELAGKDLMCWCPLPEPGQPDHCHAAVLISLANTPEGTS